MAPKKRPTMEQPTTTPVTRSSTRKTSSNPISTDPEQPKPKRVKKPTITETKPKPGNVENGSKGIVVIEHCTQCRQFKIRAEKVKEGLENGVPGLEIRVNPEKPRRGCFEIRKEGENGEKFVSLLGMKRPFGPMKALDMDNVISDIIAKIK